MRLTKAAAVGFALVLWPSLASADAIDGNWCAEDGRNFTIQGPRIVTPGGQRLDGTYERHFYSYQVPAGEPGAGQTVRMRLWDEDTVHLVFGDAGGTTEVWKRCGPTA